MMGNKTLKEEDYFSAARILEQRDFAAVPSAAELKGKHSFTNGFESNISEIILCFDSSSARRRTIGRILLAAAIIALLLAFAVSYSALRPRTYKPLTLQTYQYTDVTFAPVYVSDEAELSACFNRSAFRDGQAYLEPDIELVTHYEVSQLPDGYAEYDRITAPLIDVIVYSDGSDELIIFQQCVINTSIRINTENAVSSEITANGITFHCTDVNGYCTLLWEQEGYLFSLDCPFSSEEAIKIAESLTVR